VVVLLLIAIVARAANRRRDERRREQAGELRQQARSRSIQAESARASADEHPPKPSVLRLKLRNAPRTRGRDGPPQSDGRLRLSI
jgi:hypothetical protein